MDLTESEDLKQQYKKKEITEHIGKCVSLFPKQLSLSKNWV